MIRNYFKKTISLALGAISIMVFNPIGASAEWKQDNIGWWYTEGNSWAVDWKFINEDWYYFDGNGYMKTGWIQYEGKWYYLYDSGVMAKNTTIDGYVLDSNGIWIKSIQNNTSLNLGEDEKKAEDYVKSQGYNIIEKKEEIREYTLNKSMLYGSTESVIYQQIWGVQKVEPNKYFGNKINTYVFLVKDHPLEKVYKGNKGIDVYVMISQGKVIGGYSIAEGVDGACYSVDGKSLEQVTGLTYKQWFEEWNKKYNGES